MKKTISILAVLLAGMLMLAGCAETEEVLTPSPQEVQEEKPKVSEAAVDYKSVEITEWFCATEADSETLEKLMTIDYVQHGSAGGSMKAAIAGARLIELTKAEDLDAVLEQYLGEMNPLQKDFFSFQLEMAYQSALLIFRDFENQKLLLRDAGIEDFPLSDYAKEDLDSLYEKVKDTLTKAGVTDQWKNFPELEPFAMNLQ